MKKYTQQEFDALPVVDGIKQCPTGDYSEIKSFGEWCSFGERCSFGKRCYFGEWCSFGEWCYFGERCSFGEGCSFGKRCSFGKGCSFGEWSSFGERCSFGKRCSFENGYQAKYPAFIQINNIGSRVDGCYIYNFETGMYVRSGCFFGELECFEKAVTNKHEGNKYAKQYQIAVELAKITFDGN